MENKLTGTEKQVAWAEKIRADVNGPLQAKIAFKLATGVHGGPARTAEYRAIIERSKTETSAAWWIDNRNKF